MKTALITTILITSLLGFVALATLQDVAAPAGPTDSPATVEPWPVSIAADGVVEGAQPEVELRFEVDGVLAAVHALENQEVTEQMVLAELRNTTQQEQVALATAELEVARAQLERLRHGERIEVRDAAAALAEGRRLAFEEARSDWERTKNLFGRGTASSEQRDEAYYTMVQRQAAWDEAAAQRALAEAPPRSEDVAEAEARVAAAEARLHLAESELEKTKLRAPSDGRILRVYAEPGEVAGPSAKDPVLLLADLSTRRIRAFVEELDALRVRPGQTATVTTDGLPDEVFRGRVTLVASRMGQRAPQSDAPGEYKDLYFREVLIDLEDGVELPLNLRVQVRINVGAENDDFSNVAKVGVSERAGS